MADAVTEPGWPADWEARKAGEGCPICAYLAPDGPEHEFWTPVHDGEVSRTYLERRSVIPGYCVVVWSGDHVVEPTELEPDAAAGYWRDVLAVGRALDVRVRPVKLNYMMLGNLVPHLHTHVVPRFHGDPAPNGPLRMDEVHGPEPIPESEAWALADDLRALLAH